MISQVEAGTDWVDGRGRVLTVESIDKEAGYIYCKTDDGRQLAVDVDVFAARLKPYVADSDAPTKRVKTPSKQPKPRVWIDELSSASFAQSSRLQLSHQDWLKRGMHAKTVKFDVGQGGLPPEVNWEDRCAAIASIDHAPAKALASILLWGSDGHWDWSCAFDVVVQYLAGKMVDRCKRDGRAAPKACKHNLDGLARLMARMTLYFELYELWDVYTVKGRLVFSGIEVNSSTYTNAWLTYQRQIMDDIIDMVGIADYAIGVYRTQTNRVDDKA